MALTLFFRKNKVNAIAAYIDGTLKATDELCVL